MESVIPRKVPPWDHISQDIVNHQGDLQCKLSVGFVLTSFLKICHSVFGFRYRCPVRTSSLRLLHVASQLKEA
ncbi:hypothetical protein FOCC_FOCC007987 [Frankliniella occidentalis]|nr:hypothetical protein FOCC_FOCC007987 [Frankliniella occidentalis]